MLLPMDLNRTAVQHALKDLVLTTVTWSGARGLEQKGDHLYREIRREYAVLGQLGQPWLQPILQQGGEAQCRTI